MKREKFEFNEEYNPDGMSGCLKILLVAMIIAFSLFLYFY